VTTADDATSPYRDAARPARERVEDLLSRMTIEEKVAQLGSAWVFQLVDGEGFSREQTHGLAAHGLGHVTRVSGASSLEADAAAALANEIQGFLVDGTRLGIPAIVHEEICSGLMARGSMVYPQAIGVASTWEPELARALADAVRVQMRAMGAHQGLSPVLDICRDPRWGRTEETFGEDPYLAARMGVEFVRGLQGGDLRDGVVATAKHLVGYGASEGGMNWAPARIAACELHDVYLHPFEAAVRDAGLRSVMNAYNEIDGMPCAADRELLTGLLRDRWGFDGSVVSDYFAVRQIETYHRLAEDAPHAAARALDAGIDVELPGTDCYGAPLLDAVRSGLVAETVLDEAVRRVLATKFDLGLFERPFVDVAAVTETIGMDEQRALARTIAHKSLVLLKNDGALPLPAEQQRIAVIGPNADELRHLLGDYCYPAHVESLREMLEGSGNVFSIDAPAGLEFGSTMPDAPTVVDVLRARLGDRVGFARGCDVNTDSRAGFDEAVALAAASEVAIMVMGDKAGLTTDCTTGESRDRASLDLPGVQEDLVRAVVATGTPVVLVLVVGRPTGSAWAHEHCAAVLLAWLPGQEGAGAIADALLGDANPGGKLPISFPRSVGQLPVFYGHKVSGGRSHWKGDYVDSPAGPLYAFGHGLSYTRFELSDAATAATAVGLDGSIEVRARITNVGDRAGDEVVQVYVRDPEASLTRPVLELKSFARVELGPGESRLLTFEVPVGQLGFHDRSLEYTVEPGVFELFVGTASDALVDAGAVTVEPDAAAGRVEQAFDGTVCVGTPQVGVPLDRSR
jgi:beta-glucosidase